MAQYFEINWDRLNMLLLPTFLRKRLLFPFLKAATAPIWTIYKWFYAQRTETLFLLRYDTSKGNVERVLNIRFETDGIYIINNNNIDNAAYLPFYLPTYLSNPGFVIQTETIHLPAYLPFFIDAQKQTADFTVMVPASVYNIFSAEIERFTALFTLPGMMFNIKSY